MAHHRGQESESTYSPVYVTMKLSGQSKDKDTHRCWPVAETIDSICPKLERRLRVHMTKLIYTNEPQFETN